MRSLAIAHAASINKPYLTPTFYPLKPSITVRVSYEIRIELKKLSAARGRKTGGRGSTPAVGAMLPHPLSELSAASYWIGITNAVCGAVAGISLSPRLQFDRNRGFLFTFETPDTRSVYPGYSDSELLSIWRKLQRSSTSAYQKGIYCKLNKFLLVPQEENRMHSPPNMLKPHLNKQTGLNTQKICCENKLVDLED